MSRRVPGEHVRGGRRAIGLAVATLLLMAGVAYAAVGITNPSFEDGLNGWTAETVREGVYEPVPATDCQGIDGDAKRAICVIEGADTFTPEGGSPMGIRVSVASAAVERTMNSPSTSLGASTYVIQRPSLEKVGNRMPFQSAAELPQSHELGIVDGPGRLEHGVEQGRGVPLGEQ